VSAGAARPAAPGDPPGAVPGARLARNVLLNVAGWALPALVVVGTMPVIARRLGPERFGLLGLAWTLVGYAALLDLGLGRATTQVVAARLGRVTDDALAATAWTALTMLAALAAALALPLAVAAGPLARGALRVPAGLADEAAAAARWVALAVPFAGRHRRAARAPRGDPAVRDDQRAARPTRGRDLRRTARRGRGAPRASARSCGRWRSSRRCAPRSRRCTRRPAGAPCRGSEGRRTSRAATPACCSPRAGGSRSVTC
jgi:hypothetical protein